MLRVTVVNSRETHCGQIQYTHYTYIFPDGIFLEVYYIAIVYLHNKNSETKIKYVSERAKTCCKVALFYPDCANKLHFPSVQG